jgi:signal transduction histidine kinase
MTGWLPKPNASPPTPPPPSPCCECAYDSKPKALGTIRCQLTTDDGMAVFRIANTGAEIPEADRGRIFDRFFRVESSRARSGLGGGGQGLGLSIAREIVRAHGGTLTIEPSEAGWVVFQFTIPLCESGGEDVNKLTAPADASG